MNLERFFEKFELFADTPDAAVKLREIFIQLAVSGRLVPQLNSDEPTDLKLLSTQEMPRVQAEGRSGASLGDITPNEMPESIPPTWRWVRLFRLCAPGAPIVYGILQPGPDVRPKGVPYVRPTEIKDGVIRLDEVRHTSDGIAKQYARATIRAGDVLLTIVGTLGSTAVVPRELDGGNITQSSCRVRPDSRLISSKYLSICLQSPTLKRQYLEFSLGSAVQRLNIAHVRALAIPIPPLAEQKRIVAKIDELMTLCDRLEAQQQERQTRHTALARASLSRFADAPTPANLAFLFHRSYAIAPADLRKAILTLAVRGKLVNQDSSDETAFELIARIGVEKMRLMRSKVIKSESPLDEITEEEKLFSVPSSWSWLRAGDLCFPISSGSTPDQSVFSTSGGIPYLKVYNIRNQVVDFDYRRQFINVQYHVERMKRSRLLPGDVIMNIVGPPLGKVAIVPNTYAEWNCNQAISFFRPIFPELGSYLYLFLREGSFLRNIQLIGTAGQDNISVTKCKFIPISIPPLAEQRRIVAKVNELMALVDQLEAQLTASRSTAEELSAAIVAELTQAA